MNIRHTSRGFRRANFQDRNDTSCSVQESSVATESLLWLGSNSGRHTDAVCLARMHLSQNQAREVSGLLDHFAAHGELPDEQAKVTNGWTPWARLVEPSSADSLLVRRIGHTNPALIMVASCRASDGKWTAYRWQTGVQVTIADSPGVTWEWHPLP